MPDILTLWNTTRGDWQRDGGSLASGNDIVTSVLISLFTDRVATPDDTVPDATRRLRDPRGWWADESIGSRLWLIDRAKRTQATLQRAQAYIVEALQWLVDDGVASRIEVTTEWTRQDTLGALVVVYSPRTGAPLVKIGTQNVFRLPDAQAWGWNTERGGGQWVELQPSLTVAPAPGPPIVAFSTSLNTITWSVAGATSVSISPGLGSGAVAASGSVAVLGGFYTLTAIGPGGTATATVHVTFWSTAGLSIRATADASGIAYLLLAYGWGGATIVFVDSPTAQRIYATSDGTANGIIPATSGTTLLSQ